MTTKIKIVEAAANVKAHAEIEIIAGSEQELNQQLIDKDSNVNILITSLAASRGVVLESIVTVITPVTIVYTMDMLKKRFDFLQLTPMPCKIMVDFCNDMERSIMSQKYNVTIDTINSHFKNVIALIGITNLEELKLVFICTDEEYLKKYYNKIEAYKLSIDTTYKKRKFT